MVSARFSPYEVFIMVKISANFHEFPIIVFFRTNAAKAREGGELERGRRLGGGGQRRRYA